MKLTLTHFWIRIYAATTILSIVFYFLSNDIIAADQNSITHNSNYQTEIIIDDTEIAFTVYSKLDPKQNNNLILWLPSEHGLPDSIASIANSLARSNLHAEVWVADLLGSLFLPTQASSINKVPNTLLNKFIEKIHTRTQKKIFIIASGKGALLAMRASHYWLQDSLNSNQLGGLVLLYPNLFTKTPEPGSSADYYPVTDAVNVPIFIIQPENSPWRWQLATLQQHLVNANARPYISIMPNIRNRFFFRADATSAEQLATQNLAVTIQKSISYLQSEKIKYYSIPVKINITTQSLAKNKPSKQQATLRQYTKNPTPPALNLKNLAGQSTSLEQFRGKVIVVNFWATWCPPCVHEMPSMEIIYQRYSKSDFTILAVNMAEDVATVRDFVKNRVNVNFPILLDRDGKALKDWQVFAFPSSYVIDKKGDIRYALFGSILWDTPQVTEIIDSLLKE